MHPTNVQFTIFQHLLTSTLMLMYGVARNNIFVRTSLSLCIVIIWHFIYSGPHHANMRNISRGETQHHCSWIMRYSKYPGSQDDAELINCSAAVLQWCNIWSRITASCTLLIIATDHWYTPELSWAGELSDGHGSGVVSGWQDLFCNNLTTTLERWEHALTTIFNKTKKIEMYKRSFWEWFYLHT